MGPNGAEWGLMGPHGPRRPAVQHCAVLYRASTRGRRLAPTPRCIACGLGGALGPETERQRDACAPAQRAIGDVEETKGCACRSRTTAAARPALIAAQRVRKPMDDIMEGTHIEIRVRCQLFRQPLLRDSCICICFSLHSARRCSRALQH